MAVARCTFLALSSFLLICGAASGADTELTHLRFYVHEVDVGTNATVVNVASLHKKSSKFGDVNVFDNEVREGSDPASRLIGRAQGLAVHASLDGRSGLVAIDFVFSGSGRYSGSALTTQGPMGESGAWEQSIVGGTGKLRFARGYMVSVQEDSSYWKCFDRIPPAYVSTRDGKVDIKDYGDGGVRGGGRGDDERRGVTCRL